MKMKEKQKKRKAYEPKLTQEELMDSSTFKRFLTSIDNILENLEDVDFTTMGKYLQCTNLAILYKGLINLRTYNGLFI